MGFVPLKVFRSLPHIPTIRTRSNTSSALRVGVAISSITATRGSFSKSAFINTPRANHIHSKSSLKRLHFCTHSAANPDNFIIEQRLTIPSFTRPLLIHYRGGVLVGRGQGGDGQFILKASPTSVRIVLRSGGSSELSDAETFASTCETLDIPTRVELTYG